MENNLKSRKKVIKIDEFTVPTTAAISSVTTRKNGKPWINGASQNGGTLLWISGQRTKFILFC